MKKQPGLALVLRCRSKPHSCSNSPQLVLAAPSTGLAKPALLVPEEIVSTEPEVASWVCHAHGSSFNHGDLSL